MRPSNTGDLKPHKLISYFENILNDNLLDEVFIRRMISAVYFSLFNYWSIKNICKGIKGKGKRNDSFPHVQFIQDLVGRGFDAQIRTIYLFSTKEISFSLVSLLVSLTFPFFQLYFFLLIPHSLSNSLSLSLSCPKRLSTSESLKEVERTFANFCFSAMCNLLHN